jgi:branched-chain amino acid transport system substrate-binding protein
MERLFLALGLIAAVAVAHAQPIRIAVVGPMAFVQGDDLWAGAQLARDEINRAGGVNVGGRRSPVELLRVDTNEIESAADAARAVERAITADKVEFLVGGFRSEAVLAMQEVAMDHRKIFLGAGAAHSKLGANVEASPARYKYWFRVGPPKDVDLVRQSFAALEHIADQVRRLPGAASPKVAILAEKAAWVDGIVAAAQKNLPALKMDVVGLWQPQAAASDLAAELAAIERAGADIIFTVLSGPAGIALARQMGERGTKAVAFGINVEAQKEDFWQTAAGKANHVATLDTFFEVELTGKTIPFLRAFRERFKRPPGHSAATYDAVMLLAAAIERAGSLDADKLVAAMEGSPYTGASGVIEFDKRHDPVWGPGKLSGVAVQWQDGKRVAFWPPAAKGTQPLRLPAR